MDVLQPRGVVVVLQEVHPVRKAESTGDLHPVLILVLAVTSFALCLNKIRRRQRRLPRPLRHVVHDSVGVEKILYFEATLGFLQAEPEGDPRVRHRLSLQHVIKVFRRNVDVRKDVQVR